VFTTEVAVTPNVYPFESPVAAASPAGSSGAGRAARPASPLRMSAIR